MKIELTIQPGFEQYFQELQAAIKLNHGRPSLNESLNMAVKYYVNESPLLKCKLQKLNSENEKLACQLKFLRSIIDHKAKQFVKNKIVENGN